MTRLLSLLIGTLISCAAIADVTSPVTPPGGSSGSSVTWAGDLAGSTSSSQTIAAGAVTLAKMANLSADTLICNNTGSGATPINCTVAQVKTLLAYSFSDISGTIAAAQLPNPTASALGGIESIASASHQWVNAISTLGVPTQSQPACADLSNAAASCSTDATNASNISSGALAVGEGGLGQSTTPASAKVLIGQSSTAYAPETVSGSCTITSAGVVDCPTYQNINVNIDGAAVVTNTKFNFVKIVKASTIDNITYSALALTCSTNATIAVYECGTSTTCSSSPTTIGSGTINSTATAITVTVSNSAVTAGDYVAFGATAGSCTVASFDLNVGLHSN